MPQQIPHQSSGSRLGQMIGAVLGTLVSAIIMVGLFFLGLTVFAAAAGLAIFVFLVVAARVWWLRRKLRAAGVEDIRRRQPGSRGVTLEGEYEERRDHR